MARIRQLVQLGIEQVDIGWVQARGGLVQQIDRVAATRVAGTLQLRGQLDALSLAAGQLRRALAQAEVAQADGLQRSNGAVNLFFLGEDLRGLIHGELQDVRDGAALPGHLQGLVVEAGTAAFWTCGVRARQEDQLHLDLARAAAGGALALLYVVRKARDRPFALLGLIGGGEELANVIEKPGIGCQRGTRGAANGLLGNLHDALYSVKALRALHGPALILGLFLIGNGRSGLSQQPSQHRADQGGLARAGDTGDRCELAQAKVHIQVVDAACVDAAEGEVGGGGAGVVGKRERAVSQRIGGRGVRVIVFDRARIDHVAAALAGQRADVNEPVRLRDQIHVMLHQEHGVAGRDETAAHIHDRVALIGVQAGRGLVEHIGHAEEPGAQLRRQPDALHLAAG